MAVRVSVSGLDEMAAAFDRLGKHAFADAVQEALNDAADHSLVRMAPRFKVGIEGGPTPFTEIRPGKRSSSVVANKRKGASRGLAEASIKVQRTQSAYLKHMLGEERIRLPGDVGAAERRNFIPDPAALKTHAGITVRRGNMPRNAMRTLTKKAAKPDSDIFVGKPKGRGGRPRDLVGFWKRPANRVGALIPLVTGVRRSDYGKKEHLVDEWNDSVLDAADALPGRARHSLMRSLNALAARRGGR